MEQAGSVMDAIEPPTFTTLAGYDDWSRRNMVAFNRLAVDDPAEWERIACAIANILYRISLNRKEAA